MLIFHYFLHRLWVLHFSKGLFSQNTFWDHQVAWCLHYFAFHSCAKNCANLWCFWLFFFLSNSFVIKISFSNRFPIRKLRVEALIHSFFFSFGKTIYLKILKFFTIFNQLWKESRLFFSSDFSFDIIFSSKLWFFVVAHRKLTSPFHFQKHTHHDKVMGPIPKSLQEGIQCLLFYTNEVFHCLSPVPLYRYKFLYFFESNWY